MNKIEHNNEEELEEEVEEEVEEEEEREDVTRELASLTRSTNAFSVLFSFRSLNAHATGKPFPFRCIGNPRETEKPKEMGMYEKWINQIKSDARFSSPPWNN